MNLCIMFIILCYCTQTVLLPLVIGSTMISTFFDVKLMDSLELYENLPSFPVVSLPSTPLLQEAANLYSPKPQITDVDLQQKLQSHCRDTVTSRLSIHITNCEQTKKCSFIFTANCLMRRTDPRGLLISYRNLLRCSIKIG